MFDVLIRNGRVVAPEGKRVAHLGIRDGTVTAVVAPGEDAAGAEEIDASGKHVIPGLVDAHVHLREPGLEHKEGFGTGTMAAALGGVTTVMVMPTDKPWTVTAEQFEHKRALVDGKAHVDVALQAAASLDGGDIETLAELGAVSFEIFLSGGRPGFLVAEDADFLDLLVRVRAVGGVAGITTGSPGIVARRMAEAKARGDRSLAALAACRPPIQEALGVARVCTAAAWAAGSVHLRQISCRASVDVVERFADVDGLSCEVTPHNLALDEEDAARLGPFGVVIPPLRDAEEAAALRAALGRGTIDIVATDHAPHLYAEKQKGADDVWQAPPGLPGLQTFLPVMLALVERDELSWPDLVAACAERPARRFRLFPQKGHLGPGADADLVIVDPERGTSIRDEDQVSRAGYTPFAGWTIGSSIDTVMVRGHVVVADGAPKGSNPIGRFVRPA